VATKSIEPGFADRTQEIEREKDLSDKAKAMRKTSMLLSATTAIFAGASAAVSSHDKAVIFSRIAIAVAALLTTSGAGFLYWKSTQQSRLTA
jgi:uncharacterized membrane protein YhiD involved in acid resistance